MFIRLKNAQNKVTNGTLKNNCKNFEISLLVHAEKALEAGIQAIRTLLNVLKNI